MEIVRTEKTEDKRPKGTTTELPALVCKVAGFEQIQTTVAVRQWQRTNRCGGCGAYVREDRVGLVSSCSARFATFGITDINSNSNIQQEE